MGVAGGFALPDLKYLPLRMQMTALQSKRLPTNKGELLNGCLGDILRSKVCVIDRGQDCTVCILNRQCFYLIIFENIVFDAPPRILKEPQARPKPFNLACLDNNIIFSEDDALIFGKGLIIDDC